MKSLEYKLSYKAQDMPTVSVRISDDDKERLVKLGKLSKSIREALRFYLDSRDADSVFARLRELQRKDAVTTTVDEMVKMIKEDRLSDRRR